MATEHDTTGLDIAAYIQSTILALEASHGGDIPELYAQEMKELSSLLENTDPHIAGKIITEKTEALFPQITLDIIKQVALTPKEHIATILPNSR
jgi:hypothetical protein